jgi:small subunit ribosomal protein S20
MPRSKSILKRIRQNEKRRVANRFHKSTFKTQIKKLRKAIEEKDSAAAQKLLQPTISIIDKTAQKGIIHQNTASRYKSKLTSQVNALLSESKSA